MIAAEWADTYGIDHWQIYWSSYRKLVWEGFEHTTIKFHFNLLSYHAMSSIRTQEILYSYFNLIVISLSQFILAVCFPQSPHLF